MKKIFLLLFLIFSFSAKLLAQSFYVSSPTNTSPYKYDIHKITIKPNGLESVLVNTCDNGTSFFSIAANPTNFYWLDGSFLFHGNLNIATNTMDNCKPLAQVLSVSSALTLGSNNKVYYTDGSYLCTTDVTNGKSARIGDIHYQASGDLTFYKGGLYMASSEGLIKVDVDAPSKSFVYIRFNFTAFGLVTVATSLRKNTVYVTGPSAGGTDFYELDMENKKVLRVVGTVPYQVYDAASSVEDGTVSGIEIEKINIRQNCASPNSGIAEIVTTAHSTPFTYKLSNGQTNTTGIFQGLAAGDYTVNITSINDEQTASFTVPAYSLTPPAYKYAVKNQVCDAPGEITFSTPTGASTYKIQLGSDVFPLDHTFSNLTANTYHFTIVNDNGCQVGQADVLLPRDKCTIQFDKTAINKECSQANKGSIAVLTNAHTDAYTYTLNGVSNTTGVFNQLDPGNYQIKITSPEDSKIVPATIPDYSLLKPVITYTKTNPVCDKLGQIQFTTANSALYKFKDGPVLYAFNQIFIGLPAGVKHFTVIDQQQCVVDEFDITFTQEKCTIKFDKVVAQQQCDVIYKGTIQVTNKPHNDQYSYTMNGITNTTGYFTNLNAGSYNVKITSPEDELIVPAIVPDYKALQPLISIIKTDHACATKGTIKFTVQDNNTSQYKIQYLGDIYPFDHIFDNLAKGNYQFTVLKQNGCIVDNYDAEITYVPCPIVINDISATAECHVLGKGFVTVTCPPIPETYSYTLNNTKSTTGVFNMLSPGNYQLTVSASGGGTPQQRTVIVPDFSLNKPATIVNTKLPVCTITGQISLSIDNAQLYNISYNSSVYPADHVFTDLFAGTYHFDILKKDGCIVDAIDVPLALEPCTPVVFPNTFTPNNDGVNDIFRASPTSKGSHFNLKIFDRSGMLLFFSNELTAGWNGEFKGRAMPPATYYYLSTFVTQEGKSATMSGSVTLIR